MTKLTSLSFLFAAGTLLSTATAYGQTLRAEIPFAFQASRTAMPAGTYDVKVDSLNAGSIIRLYDRKTKKSAVVLAQGSLQPSAREGRRGITFTCRATCSMQRVETGETEYLTPQSKPKTRADERLTYVSMNREQ